MTTIADHPMHPLIVHPETGDTYYQGDLGAGVALARRDRFPIMERGAMGGYYLILSDSESRDDAAEGGAGPDEETAWRYALGAMFGPIDAEYDERGLIAALQVHKPTRDA